MLFRLFDDDDDDDDDQRYLLVDSFWNSGTKVIHKLIDQLQQAQEILSSEKYLLISSILMEEEDKGNNKVIEAKSLSLSPACGWRYTTLSLTISSVKPLSPYPN